MKILTTKQQYEALGKLDFIRCALNNNPSENVEQWFKCIEYLANLTYIVGGLDALKERSNGGFIDKC